MYKKILDRDQLKSKEDGVAYFKRTLIFWMHMKMFSTVMMSKMKLGSSVVFKAADREKARVKDAEAKAAAEAAVEENSSNHAARRKATVRRNMAKKNWSWQAEESWWWQANQPDDGWAADSWQSWDQESALEQVEF